MAASMNNMRIVRTLINPCFRTYIRHMQDRMILKDLEFNSYPRIIRRSLRRRPIRVITDSVDELQHREEPTSSAKEDSKYSPPLVFRGKGRKLMGDGLSSSKTHLKSVKLDRESTISKEQDPIFNVRYEKLGPGDKSFGRVMVMAKNRKQRDKSEKVILEGRRLITDAILCGATCHSIYFSSLENLQGIPVEQTDAKFLKMPYADFKIWSDHVAAPGVVGVFSKPNHETLFHGHHDTPLPLTLICENIREPGNLGTLLRSAAAANCNKILLLKGCVDIWEQKVLRAAAGAHFHTPIISRIHWKEVPNYLTENEVINVADNSSLPLKNGEEEEDVESDQRFTNVNSSSYIPTVHHYEVDWTQKSALVIGGETEGLSLEAVDMCERSDGSRIHIPMSKSVESLNVGISGSIILFEAKRQWLSSMAKR